MQLFKIAALPAALALFVAPLALARDAGHDSDAPAPARSGQGSGVVKSVDAKTGKVTLHHGPVPALGWPAMTMAFKAEPKLLRAVKAGQTVTFTVVDGETPEVTALSPR